MRTFTTSRPAIALLAGAALALVAFAGRGAPARALSAEPASATAPLVLPALDRVVARLAADARSHP